MNWPIQWWLVGILLGVILSCTGLYLWGMYGLLFGLAGPVLAFAAEWVQERAILKAINPRTTHLEKAIRKRKWKQEQGWKSAERELERGD